MADTCCGRADTMLRAFFVQEAARHPIVLAYLFGSRASGTEVAGSDYDVGVLFAGPVPSDVPFELQHRLAVRLGTGSVDLVVLNRAPVELQYNVIAQGRVVYQADEATRVEFEARTMSVYFDQLPELRRQRRELLAQREVIDAGGVRRYREALRETRKLLAETGASEDTTEG